MCKKIFATLFLLLTLSATPSFASGEDASVIIATGEGEVAAPPDAASVVLSVKNNASSAQAAQSANARTAARVIGAVKGLGILSENIKTSGYSVYPVYDNKTRRIDGYSAENSVTVKISGADKVGNVIDAAIAAGANQISSVRFYVSDAKKFANEALKLAVKDAREQAEITARALGVSVVGVKKASPNISRRSVQNSRMLMKAANDSTPIEAGEVFVTASVTVEFIIK